MKTSDILMIAAGVGIVGYLVYQNKKQQPKPLDESNNEPLTNPNQQAYRTEEEKPAADPVMKTAVDVIKEPADSTFYTGEYVTQNPLPIPKYNSTTPFQEDTPVLKPLVADVSPSAPVVSITATKEQPTTLLYNNRQRNIAPSFNSMI